jgi:hypothetical protein
MRRNIGIALLIAAFFQIIILGALLAFGPSEHHQGDYNPAKDASLDVVNSGPASGPGAGGAALPSESPFTGQAVASAAGEYLASCQAATSQVVSTQTFPGGSVLLRKDCAPDNYIANNGETIRQVQLAVIGYDGSMQVCVFSTEGMQLQLGMDDILPRGAIVAFC